MRVPIWLAIPIIVLTLVFLLFKGAAGALEALERRAPRATLLIVRLIAIGMLATAVATAASFYGERYARDVLYDGIETVPSTTTFSTCGLVVLGGALLCWSARRWVAWLVIVFGLAMIAKPLIYPMVDNVSGDYHQAAFESGTHSRFWLPGAVTVLFGAALLAGRRRTRPEVAIPAARIR